MFPDRIAVAQAMGGDGDPGSEGPAAEASLAWEEEGGWPGGRWIQGSVPLGTR